MHLRRVSLITLAMAASLSGVARAGNPEAPTAVLGLEATDVPPEVADGIVAELRQRVEISPSMKLVSGKDLVEIKLVFSCADEAHGCMGQAGKSLGAAHLIYGSIKEQGDDYAIWLKLFDVEAEKLEAGLTDTIGTDRADAAGIKAAAGKWFAKLTGEPANVGTIKISANVFGATVLLDGKPVGSTGEQPLAIPGVAAGRHEIVAEKAGREAARRQLVVAANQTSSVTLSFPPAGGVVASPSPSDSQAPPAGQATQSTDADDEPESTASRPADLGVDDGRGGYRTGFWITLAAGAASAAAAVKYGLDVARINKDLDPYRNKTLTPDQRKVADDKLNQGNRAQTLQWVFVGLGSAFGIASGYLLYRGYLDSDGSPATGHQEAHRGLRIFPTAGASSGGILAEFEF